MKLHFDVGSSRCSIDVTAPGPIGRMRGLIGRAPPGRGTGLLLKGKRIHTFLMAFPIDVVYLDDSMSVVDVRTHPPNRLGPRVQGATAVLELAEGESSRLGLMPGMRLREVAE